MLTGCGKVEYNYLASSPKPIVWDTSTLVRVSPRGVSRGYPRLIQLKDKSLFVTYDGGGAMRFRRSFDYGKTWDDEHIIVSNTTTHTMSNPEIQVQTVYNKYCVHCTTTIKNNVEIKWLL